jgi:hypothetical protein
MQIVGRHRDDWGVLQMAHAFEQSGATLSGPRPAPWWRFHGRERDGRGI